MKFTKTIYAIALGSVGIMGALSTVSASAAPLAVGATLTIDTGVPTFFSSGLQKNIPTGSWFGMDTNGGGIAGNEKTALSQGTTGIIIGATTTAGASHGGAPVAGDTNAITAPWFFFNNTGSDFNTVAITAIGGDTANGLDFSGWRVTWNGIPSINMGGGAWGAGFSNGVANFSWDGNYGSTYTLDYHATVPVGDPSNFGGVNYALRLTGTVLAPVPEASTYGMMIAGLGLVGFMASRRRKSV